MHEIDKPKDHLGVALSDIRFGEVRCTCGEVRQFLDLCALLHLLSGIFKSYIVFLLVIKTVIGGADIDSLLQKRLVPQSLDIPRIRQRMLFIIPVASIDVLDLNRPL